MIDFCLYCSQTVGMYTAASTASILNCARLVSLVDLLHATNCTLKTMKCLSLGKHEHNVSFFTSAYNTKHTEVHEMIKFREA